MENASTLKRLIILLIILAIATGVSLACGSAGSKVGPISVFALCSIAAFVINWIAYIPANAAKTEKFFDLTGTITYLSLITIAAFLTPELSMRAMIVAIMVCVWAVRLGIFLFGRISRDGHDARFDKIKVDPLRFFIVWTIQALWVLLTATCALVIITSSDHSSLGTAGIIGIIIWVLGFMIEIIADQQKTAFRSDPKNKGKFIKTGLWSWSRHPNYFGEILLWSGIAVMALPILSGWQWVALISPFFVAFLLLKVSGVPMLAAKGMKRWGDDPAYKAYLKNTSLLVPLPPKGT